jgi:serine/threonine-protein kinase
VNSKDKVSANEDYEHAIQHYQNLLDLNASNEEEIVVKIGVIYQEMGEPTRAVEQFQNAIKNYPESIDAYVKLGNLLLDIEQSKDEGSRNYQAAQLIFEQANTLDGAGEDEAFKKLVRRFDNLSIN